MKIAMFYDARDIVGGGRNHVENICYELCTNHGCEIDLYTRAVIGDQIPLKEQIKGFNIIYCGNKKDFFHPIERITSMLSMIWKCIKGHNIKRYDIIHAHSYLPLLAGKITSQLLHIPIISTIHGSQLMDIGIKTLGYYIQKILLTQIKYNHEICVGSNFLNYPNINQHITNIGNGVYLKEYEGSKIDHYGFNILFVGRLERTKGVDTLIDAIEIVHQKHKTIYVNIVGYGYDEDNYKAYVSRKGLDNIISFEGKKTGRQLLHYYKISDLMVVPSRAEGFGIIILEAMAAGIPVIATKSGGPEDIIQHGVNGILVPKENPELLAQEIIKFIANQQDVSNMVRSGQKTIRNRYTRKIIANQLFNLYTNTIVTGSN